MVNAPPAGDGARSAALGLLHQVLDRGRTLDEAWADGLGPDGAVRRLAGRDRAFARLLAGVVLRRLGQLDAVLTACLDRPPGRKMQPALLPLRLAAAQLLFLGTPPHAAVDGAVRQMRRQPQLRGMVNAVARRIAREGEALLAAGDGERANCPDWLWRSWEAAYGEAETRAMVAAMLAEPTLHLTVRSEPEVWAERLQAELMPTGTLRRAAGGRIEELAGFGEGAWWVQDAAAALPARLLGDVRGRRVLDLCAAPGGKTAQLAAAGADVTALDISGPRLQRVRENLQRLRLKATLVEADAAEWRSETPFEAILLDAPCTSTGTIRRHPDVWRLKQPEDVARMAELQDRLLRAALALLAPGGVLVYCTCSLQPEEGPERIAALLAEKPPLRRLPLKQGELKVLPEAITAAGDLRTLPHHLGGIDGFYACQLIRTPD